jgi:hypothetical protein
MSSPAPSDPDAPAPPRSIRLTLAYDESGVRVIDRTPVTKPVPASVPAPPPSGAPARGAAQPLPTHAVVAELRSDDDSTTYRQIVEHAIPHDVEVFEPGVERGVRRHGVPLATGVFTVIVPDDEAASSVVVLAAPQSRMAPPDADTRALAGPVELTRFSLRGPDGGNG